MDFSILPRAGWLILGALVVTGWLVVHSRVEIKEIFPRAGKYIIAAALVVCVVIAFAVVATQCETTAHAQDIDRAYPDEEATILALARVCWSERDARVDTNDCAAIAQVTRTRAALTKRTLLEQLRAYSPEATAAQDTERERQRWVSQLRLDAEQPDEWSVMNARREGRGLRPLPWRSIRARWIATIEEARALLNTERRVCTEPPSHWGGTMDAAPRHWVRIDCGRTVNRFYRVPRVPRGPGPRGGTLPARVAHGD